MPKFDLSTECYHFTSDGEQLVSWGVRGASLNADGHRVWQCSSGVIATIEEAEAFSAKLTSAIGGAKILRARANAVADLTARVDGEIKAGK